ncbi:histone-like nucleoid-structuring protein Lsr2 [Streptomyces sp. NRRL F-2664]|uniref:histone-like nucleoid-structuring protein Lsr2 n=1 Tax=Streptomyces sp. NRRL F-2664 TaxID=1463842 RepID=UPI000997D536|nr:Lsr2 family protein [Streptomyces sp. NRRL F-2664]
MAQKQVTIFIDDVTGRETAEGAAHSFSLDGVEYEIDLSPESYDKLLEDLAPYLQVARRVRGGRRPRRSTSDSDQAMTGRIREWARLNNLEVNTRGRIPADVRAAYEAAH